MRTEVRKLLLDGLIAIACLTLVGLVPGLPAGAESLVEGHVRLASGEPVSAAQVRLFGLTDLRQLAGTTTDETGYFALPLESVGRKCPELPEGFFLGQNYPNPFNPSTNIPYQLPASTHVRLEVFNVLGQHLATLAEGVQSAGFHTARWDGTDVAGRAVAAGVYLYRLQSGGTSLTQRMVLVDGQAGIAEGIGPGSAPTAAHRPLNPGTQIYGLTVSGPEIITYIDPDFRIPSFGGPVELVVEALDSTHRSKAAASRLLGDVNNDGRVDISDALIVVIYSLDHERGITVPNQGDIALGDVNRDMRVDLFDALLILTYLTDPSDPSLPAGIGEPIAPTEETPKMYWTGHDVNKIRRADLDGSNLQDLVTTGAYSAGLALDADGGKMYWTDVGSARIHRADLDGSNLQDLITTEVGSINWLALDVAGGKMYWTDWRTDKIQRANLDGSNIQDLITTGLTAPHGLALDVAGGKMYWTDNGAARIQRANLDGSDIQDLVSTGLVTPRGLALDVGGGKMYWTDAGTHKIQRANLDGSQVEDLVTSGVSAPHGLALDVAGGKMYWTDLVTHKIQRANLDGSQVEDLVTSGLSRPWGLALDLSSSGPAPGSATLSPDPSSLAISDDGIWHSFTVRSGEPVVVVANPSGSIPRVESTHISGASNHCPARSGDSLTRQDGETIYLAGCAAGQATVELRRATDQTLLRTYTFTIEEAPAATTGPGSAKIYWANGEKIQRADGDGFNVEDVVTSGSPRELAVDVLEGKVYWTDQDTRKIRRADLDGSNAEDIVSTGLISPVGIALDPGRGKIYWTDTGSNKIQRANLDGSQIENLVSIGLHSPEGLALDAAAGKIYWSDFGIDKIQRANLDGSQVEDLVSTGLSSPGGLALDAAAGKLYWSDFGTDKIQRANLDGSNIEDIVATGLRIPKGLALDSAGGKIYWTDSGTNKVQRANLDGSNVEDLLSGEAGTPLGLAVISPVASLSPNPSAVTFSRDGSWRSFTLQASEPIVVVVNPSGIPARMLVDESSGSSAECPAQGENSITRYNGQSVYLAGCETGEATVELRRAADQAVLHTYTIRVSGASKIYWIDADSRKIQRSDLDGSNVEDLVTGLSAPVGLALDVAGGKMYWTDKGTDRIHRSNLDGSDIEDLITTGLREPRRVALDLTGGKIYWADATTDKIQRADLGGANIEDLVTGLVEPRGLALDVAGGKIYWTDRSANKIQRADLDGSNVEDLVTGLREPVGLALDLAGGKIYWADSTTDRIQRANFDGSNVEDILTAGLGEPRGLALDIAGGKIYWADNGTDSIRSVNLDGSHVQVIRRVVTPIGIALDTP